MINGYINQEETLRQERAGPLPTLKEEEEEEEEEED